MTPALFSLTASRQAVARITPQITSLLKGCALLYPQLIVFINRTNVEDVADAISPGVLASNRKKARSFLVPISRVDKRWERSVSDSDLLKDLDTWVGANRETTDIDGIRALIRDWLASADRIAHPVSALAISTSLNFPYHDDVETIKPLLSVIKDPKSVLTSHREMTLVLPRLSDLAWDEVWELRDSPYLERFRAFAQGNLPVGVSDTEVSELISDALWKVVGRARPSGNGSVVARVAGTIPVPLGIPNPLALFRDVRDGKAERALYVDLGWLFFLQEVKERTAE